MIHELEPMLASAGKDPFDDPHYLFDYKLDGVRCLVLFDRPAIRFYSRSMKDHTLSLPDMLSSVKLGLPSVHDCLLDAEFICEKDGKFSFELAQGAFGRSQPAEIAKRLRDGNLYTLVVHDILWLNGQDLTINGTQVKQLARKRMLQDIMKNNEQMRRLGIVHTEGKQYFKHAISKGYEGIMAKNKQGLYEPGKRPRNTWIKLKPFMEDSFAVIGWTKGKGRREATIGGLMLANLDVTEYRGIVGAGLSDMNLAEMKPMLEGYRTFEDPYFFKHGRSDVASFISPPIVVDVKYQEMTKAGRLRFPAFLRIREDMME